MPGIAGIITKVLPPAVAAENLRRMVGALRHESFYVSGTWIDERSGIYIGWTSRENSAGPMPIRNEREDRILVFSGEEFPEPGTAQALRSRGHEFSPSGFSYLIHLAEEDQSFPAGLNGRFHGLLTNCEASEALLFNDRYSMHRLYYHESDDGFYFGAEAKAILAAGLNLRNFDVRSLGEFISCGSVLDNRTLLQGIHVLPPASAWVFQQGKLTRKSTYFDPKDWEEQDPLDPESFYRELRTVFARNLPRYFNGNQQLGMSLTGGLDTRMIMAWQKKPPGTLPCYTFGGTRRDCQDVIVARQVARACEQTHQTIPVGHEFLSRFPHYAERAVYLADGCVDASRAPDLYLNERAREVAPVRITGNYGSEILRNVRAFKAEEPKGDIFCPEVLGHVHSAKETFARVIGTHPVSFAAFRLAPWCQHGILSLEETQLSSRSPFLDNDLVRTVFRAPRSSLNGNGVSLRLIGDGNPDLLRAPTDRGLGGGRSRAVEAASRAYLEFLFRAEYAYDQGMPQWVARIDHSVSRLRLDRLFTGRHKFSHFRIWYRDILGGYLQDTLLSSRSSSRPYLNRKSMESVLGDHLKGTRNWTREIHKVLTLEIFCRLFLDNPIGSPMRGPT